MSPPSATSIVPYVALREVSIASRKQPAFLENGKEELPPSVNCLTSKLPPFSRGGKVRNPLSPHGPVGTAPSKAAEHPGFCSVGRRSGSTWPRLQTPPLTPPSLSHTRPAV